MAVARAIRELWEENPYLVAAAIAPIVFGATFAIAWWAINDGGRAGTPAAVVQQSAAGEQIAARFDAAVERGEATVGLQPALPRAEAESAVDAPAAVAEAGEEAADPIAASEAAVVTEDTPIESLPALADVLTEQLDPTAMQYGGTGSEGSILPIANGIVRSSGPPYQTSWQLLIPQASLYASIVKVGQTWDGKLGAPDNPEVIGWYREGPRPGDFGNVLLTGHLDYRDVYGTVGQGVCYRLRDVVIGGQIYVRDAERNLVYVYQVEERATVDPRDVSANRYLSQGPGALLTLITCSGIFDEDDNDYSQRLVLVGRLLHTTRS